MGADCSRILQALPTTTARVNVGWKSECESFLAITALGLPFNNRMHP